MALLPLSQGSTVRNQSRRAFHGTPATQNAGHKIQFHRATTPDKRRLDFLARAVSKSGTNFRGIGLSRPVHSLYNEKIRDPTQGRGEL